MAKELNNQQAEELAVQLFHKLVSKRGKLRKKFLKRKINTYGNRILKSVGKIRCKEENKLLTPLLDQVEVKANQILALGPKLDKTFSLFIMGMGSFGKSTLVNALIGKRVAETDVFPKTWKIDIFEAAATENQVEIYFKDGSSKNYSRQKAIEYIAREEEKIETSKDKRDDKYYSLKRSLDSVEAKEELKEKLTKEIVYQSPIVEVHWPCKVGENSLLNKFNIVDTPGLFQEDSSEKTKQDLRSYYHDADGVLWMLDATTLASQQPKKLLDNLDKALARIDGKTDNVVGVLNKIDLVRRNNPDNVERVINQAREIFADYFLDVVPVSAKEAINGLEDNDYQLYQQSGFVNLRRAIDSYFLRKESRLQSESKLKGLKGYLTDIRELVADYTSILREDEAERKRLKKWSQNYIQQEKEKVNNMLTGILTDYKRRVKLNIESQAEHLFDYDEEEQDKCERFLRKNIFLEDRIINQLKEFNTHYQNIVKSTSKKVSSKSQFSEFKYIDKESKLVTQEFNHKYNNNWNLANIDLSKNSTLGNIGTIVAGGFLLGPVGVVLGAVANSLGLVKWAVVQFKLPGLKKKLKRKLSTSIKDVKKKIEQDIDRDFARIIPKVNQVREESFAALHGPSENYSRVLKQLRKIKNLEKDKIKFEADMVELITRRD